MTVTSPAEFLRDLDVDFFRRYQPLAELGLAPVEYVEPDLSSTAQSTSSVPAALDAPKVEAKATALDRITSKIVTLGDFIDTDAVCRPCSLALCWDISTRLS
jgi:hypothetical protein